MRKEISYPSKKKTLSADKRCVLTEKNLVSFMAQKKITVISAKYPPRTMPVAKISFSFQLSGIGDGFTLSLDIVMIVPGSVVKERFRFLFHK